MESPRPQKKSRRPAGVYRGAGLERDVEQIDALNRYLQSQSRIDKHASVARTIAGADALLAHSTRWDEVLALLREQNVDTLADALHVTSIIERALRTRMRNGH